MKQYNATVTRLRRNSSGVQKTKFRSAEVRGHVYQFPVESSYDGSTLECLDVSAHIDVTAEISSVVLSSGTTAIRFGSDVGVFINADQVEALIAQLEAARPATS